jgi:hypothetical protein
MALTGEKKREWQRAYNIKNRKKVNQASYLWKQNNKEKTRLFQRKSDLKSKYGITLDEYNELFKKQKGLCAVCLRPRNDFKYNFAVDHCHKTNKIRGLLCSNCNTTVGLVKENYQTMQRIIGYLSLHQLPYNLFK